MNYRRLRNGFTLVELLVVIAIIGILVALLLPAVQSAREAGRRTHCSNNIRQLAQASRGFESQKGHFTPGHTDYGTREHSWMTLLLPFVEQQALFDKYDFSVSWSHANNQPVKEFNLAVQLCPSATHKDKGQGDYAGINGPRGLAGLPEGWDQGQSFAAGMMVAVGGSLKNLPIRTAHVRDGLSKTLLIGESASRTDANRFWADAHQTFAQHGALNKTSDNEMYSEHRGGVMMAFADGSIRFISEGIEMSVIDAIGTRARGEDVDLPSS